MANASTADVIAGRARWSCVCSDAIGFLCSLPDDSIDLLFTSPPYLEARTYSTAGVSRKIDAWVPWMMEVVRAAAPKVKGLIAVNCEGQTRNYAYQPAPYLLMADLYREGFNLRKPPVFHRVGIPGSGGPDWLRNDYEPIICVTREGRLPWSDNTVCGHPPKWAPGGEMSNRTTEGARVNQWGHSLDTGATVVDAGGVVTSKGKRPSHFRAAKDGTVKGGHKRDFAQAIANPGNVLSLNVGGGVMGHSLAHDNEAPFPLELPTFFVRSFAPPNGIVCDPFAGSCTTGHAALEHNRRFVGCDIRESQIALAERRLATVTPSMFDDEVET